MPVLTPTAAFNALLSAGMPRNRCTEFVAIARCESSLNTEAISPVGALGLWQIMPFNFPGLGLSVMGWDDPNLNARAAVLLSGHGANCAAWDTCYANIQASGRFMFLNWPQAGSCAFNNLGATSVIVGTHNSGGAAAPPFPGVDGSLEQTVATYQALAHQVMPANGGRLRNDRAAVGRLYTR